MSFDVWLKKALDEKGMTQAQLAAVVGVGRSSVSQYVAGGQVPRDKVKEQIARALGCSFVEIKPSPPVEHHDSTLQTFSTKKITLRQAAKVLHVSERVLAQDIKAGKVGFAQAFKEEIALNWNFYISPKLFYEFTGWKF